MDDRYLYFALADPDFFDVPWAIEEAQPVDLSSELTADWTVAADGPWQLYRAPGVWLPNAGWKVHVSMVAADAERVLAEVARACVRHVVCFKTLRGARLIRASHLKYAPESISGKVATVYPTNNAELAAVVEDLACRLRGTPAPTLPGEANHADAPLGVRWGSYVETWIEAPDGRTVPGVRDGDGDATHDSRTARRPLPQQIEHAFPSDPRRELLPITDATVLHRSNAGGVYVATLRTGETVVLKEARRHTGLAPDGVDAVTRLRHEQAVLERLRGLDIAPDPIDYWKHDDSEFLVMESLEGPSLAKRIGRYHPQSVPNATVADRSAFGTWAENVVADLHSVVDRMHDAGVAHGDIQPGNVVLHDGVRLVDFESARLDGTTVSASLGTPGFVSDATDLADRDRFALQRLDLLLRNPDALLVDRRPDLQAVLEHDDPPKALDADARTNWVSRLVDGILSRATPHRNDRLFPGGIEQFTVPLGGRNVMSGAAGVLLALHHHARPIDTAHVDWLATLPDTATECRGLAEGIDGIALALARLGREDRADHIADSLIASAPQGISWSRGRAGIAVALAELGTILDRTDLRYAATTLVESVNRDVYDPAYTVPGPGLLHGWAGVSLGLLRACEILGLDGSEPADHAIRRELGLLETRGDCLVSTIGGRIRTGLGHGCTATAVAVAATGVTDRELRDAQRRASRTTERIAAPVGGLLDGVAGDVVVLDAVRNRRVADERCARATWYCVPTSRGWSTLGAQRMRCSDDLGTGTAGLLLALSNSPATALADVLSLPVRVGVMTNG